MIKRYIGFFLSIAAVFSLLSVCSTFQVSAAEDATPPELVSFEILDTELEPLDQIAIKILVRESETGLSRLVVQFNHVDWATNGANSIYTDLTLGTPLYSSGDSLIEYTIILYAPTNAFSGDWYLGTLELYDQKDNFIRYCGTSEGTYLQEVLPVEGPIITGNTKFNLASASDDGRPHINSINITTPVVEKPGVLRIELDVTCASPFSYAQINLNARNGTDTLVHFVHNATRIGETGLIFEIPIDQLRHLGDWYIAEIRLYDTKATCALYHNLNGQLIDYYDATNAIDIPDFTITGEMGDEVKPVLNSITVLNEDGIVEKPGILKVEIDITEEGSGVTGIEVYYERIDTEEVDYNSRTIYDIYVKGYDRNNFADAFIDEPLYTGKHILGIPIYSTKHAGKYAVTIRMLEDASQNQANDYIWEGESAEFTVADEFDYIFEYGITNQGLLSAIQNMQEGEVGRILLSDKKEDNILTKEMLDAIAGQKKTLVCYRDGYQWIFEGKKLNPKKTKDLNLTMRVAIISGENLSSGKDAVCLSFENNGDLPGPVQFRFKTAFVKEFFGREEHLHMFHVEAPETGYETDIDYENSDYEEIAHKDVNFKVVMEEKDAWCYVNLHHNSKYIVSDAKIVKYTKPDNNQQNTTPSTKPTEPTVTETEPTEPETEPTEPETIPPETEPTEGTQATEPEATLPTETSAPSVPSTEPVADAEETESGSEVIWIALAVVILAGLSVGGIFAYKKYFKK